ncbi:MAG: hypothetical protein ACUVX9_15120 [Anaerolineae bacterium]
MSTLAVWWRRPSTREGVGAAQEWLIILLWACFVGRAYLDFSSLAFPYGGEFAQTVHSHYTWELLRRCGSCFLWNGFVNGGSPAFAEVHGSVLHPLVMITTLIWGVLNGAKVTLICSLAMAGLAQWWLAKTLRLGAVARLWSAGLAVAGGHLAGRMEDGLLPLMLSTAACSLALAALVEVLLRPRPKAVVGLAVSLALALVSGQGYLQIAFLLNVLPASLLLLLDRHGRLRPQWRDLVLALGLAVLLAAVYWVPMLHYLPQFVKDADPAFKTAQPLEYLPLNLVIRDHAYFRTETLGRAGFPFLYANYIGWVPVLLAALALRLVPRGQGRILAFLATTAGVTFLMASAVSLRWLGQLLPGTWAGIRNPSPISGLVVPCVLLAAAWGLDELLRRPWPILSLTDTTGAPAATGVRLSWLVLAVPLLWSLQSALTFGQAWLRCVNIYPGDYHVAEALRTPDSQWVLPPFGEHYWGIIALDKGLKITQIVRPWAWKERRPPAPYREALRGGADASVPGYLGQVNDFSLIEHRENIYAYIEAGDQCVPCRAQTLGGRIDVVCPDSPAGTLVVRENRFSGWQAWRDGVPAPIQATDAWLRVTAPAGGHRYRFRYQPWDVPLGLALTLIGVGACVRVWRRPEEPLAETSPASADGVQQAR